ncbi:MAG: CHASE2 domain-containing protein, partial [Gammaproteobacteria bacterium]|nr:CHASE2 domain-containing protein [Gammaproteobacteria bacterium]
MISNKTKLILRPVLIILMVSIITSALHNLNSFRTVEGITYDWRMKQSRANDTISEDIAVILIDDASLQSMDNYAGRWPWPRFVYADLLEFLSYANPKGVLFDITFTEKHKIDVTKGEAINQDDQELVQATATYPFAYHAARFVLDSLANDESGNARLNKALPDNFESHYSIEKRITERHPEPTLISGVRAPDNNYYYLPFDELLQTSNGIGVVEVQTDHDSVLRRGRLFHSYLGQHYPSLSTAAFFDNSPVKKIERINNSLLFDEQVIPLDQNEKMLVNYYGKYKEFSFSGIIASLQKINEGDIESLLIDPAELAGKYIFVGGSAAGLNDLKNTPMDANLPGVFVHASILSNILTNDFLKPPNNNHTYILIFLFALVTTLSVLFAKKMIIQNGLPITTGVLFAWFSYYQFEQNIVIDV